MSDNHGLWQVGADPAAETCLSHYFLENMKINVFVAALAVPVVAGSAATSAGALTNRTMPDALPRTRVRRTLILPKNITSAAGNATRLPSPTVRTDASCAAAFRNHGFTGIDSRNPAEQCAQEAAVIAKQSLIEASAGFGIAGDDAMQAGYLFKAALLYSKAAVIDYTLRTQNDAGLFEQQADCRISTGLAQALGQRDGSTMSMTNTNEDKAFLAFQQIGDSVSIKNLRKNLGASARARFPELDDVEKVKRYNFHDNTAWKNVSTPGDFGIIETTLNSGNLLRIKFDTDLKGLKRLALTGKPLPDLEDLKFYGNAFTRLIDLSPTFRSYLYSLLERQGSPDYTIRVNIERNAAYAGYTAGGAKQTIFPYNAGTNKSSTPITAVQAVMLHEFAHNVQPGIAKDRDGTTILQPDQGYSHDREQTAFMGGVINEYNHFLKIAYSELDKPESLGKPIRKNIDRDDYCEDLLLKQPEWHASKASGYLKDAATAIEKDEVGAALKIFSRFAPSEKIDIRMYNAQFGHNTTHSEVQTYDLAEVTLQQLLVEVDRIDWLAFKTTSSSTRSRETMAKFLNALVERGPAGAGAPDWRAKINGAFNYLSMDPKVEIPGYAYADGGADTVAAESANPDRTADGTSGSCNFMQKSQLAVMAAMSIVIVGLSAYIAKKAHATRHPAATTFPETVATAEPQEMRELPV